jgi:dephospho-CoA kinase
MATAPASHPAFVVGVTGGIGSGKSTAARMFAEYGAGLVDTDAIALALTQAGQPAVLEIAQRFGPDYVTPEGALDRARMRTRVFADPAAKQQLEAILHPLIRAEVAAQVRGSAAPYLLILIPLLVETGGYPTLAKRILVVDADERTQIERTMARSALTEDQVRAIMRTQVSRQERLAAADDIIDNNGGLDHLRGQVQALHRAYLQMAAAPHP